MRVPPRFVFFILIVTFLAGCASGVYYVIPREWASPSAVDSILASYRPALQGHRIFLDPGHGGDDRNNRGPQEEAIEADVNLRVALALRSYLVAAGAQVFTSRERDTTVALRDRPLLALQDSAEIFISLHHNATASADPSTNYSAVFYHAREGFPEYHPANHDLARYIQRDMSYAMRNAGAPFSSTFDGTLSDFDIYPNSGFAVLRDNLIPSVLIEASFHTHPPEERRLAIEEFNRIEAWGIFLGIGKYFRAGIPNLALRSDSIIRVPRPLILIEAQPAPLLDRSTLRLFVDKRELPTRDTLAPGIAAATVDRDLSSGNHQISAWVRNRLGNHSWPFRRTITAMLPAKRLEVALHPATLPVSSLASMRLAIRAYDGQERPVADGSPIRLRSKESGIDTALTTLNGTAVAYLNGTATPGRVTAGIESGNARMQGVIQVRPSAMRYVSGQVRSDSGTPIAGALITRIVEDTPSFPPDTLDVTPPDGRYIVFDTFPDFIGMWIEHAGYFKKREIVQPFEPVMFHDITLVPIAEGKLFGKTYVLDARYGGMQAGDTMGTERSSDLNLAVVRRLHELLMALGANAVLMRHGDEQIAEPERARRSAVFPNGVYLRIDASSQTRSVACEIFPNPGNRIIGSALLAGIAASTGLDTVAVAGSGSQFYRDVAMSTISLILPSVRTGYYAGVTAQRVDAIAWGILKGILELEGYHPAQETTFFARTASGTPLTALPVVLDETVSRYTDGKGIVDFIGLEKPGSRMTVPAEHSAVIVPFVNQPGKESTE